MVTVAPKPSLVVNSVDLSCIGLSKLLPTHCPYIDGVCRGRVGHLISRLLHDRSTYAAQPLNLASISRLVDMDKDGLMHEREEVFGIVGVRCGMQCGRGYDWKSHALLMHGTVRFNAL